MPRFAPFALVGAINPHVKFSFSGRSYANRELGSAKRCTSRRYINIDEWNVD